jgi:hypothetical protein
MRAQMCNCSIYIVSPFSPPDAHIFYAAEMRSIRQPVGKQAMQRHDD